MKRIFKSFLLLIVCLSLGACSCFKKEKTYSGNGMSITMEDGFYEKEIVAATYYLESTSAIMHALKEEFQTLLPSSTTLQRYATMVQNNNRLESEVSSRENEEYLYFEYEKTANGKDFFYLATVHKADDSFWLIQFACSQDDKEDYKDKFLKWADTITFDNQDNSHE